MKILTKRMLTLAGVFALGLTFAQAQSDSALLDALVKKGVLTSQEAQDIQASDAKQYDTTSASKFALADYINKLTFYGDGRLRFENIEQHNEYPIPYVNDRERYRLRFGLLYNYSDHLSAGFELNSGTADDTANQTMGSTFSKASINIGKVYLQYAPTDWLSLVAGKFANPWYSNTDIVYANDLNPEGGAEVLNWTFPLGGSSGTVVTDPKDIKSVVTSGTSDSSLSVGLTSVQYLYVNGNEVASPGTLGLNTNDVWIFGNQIPIVWNINKDVKFKVAPGFTFYTGGGNFDNWDSGVPTSASVTSGTNVASVGPGTLNSANDPVFVSPKEADDLNVVSVPGEFDFKLGNVPFRPYWDFDWNVTGKQRVQSVYLDSTAPGYTAATAATARKKNEDLGDNVAWGAGLQVGQNKKKGDWSVLGEFRQIGLGAVDQNINGTDFADSYANQQGVKVSGAYNFTDFLTGTVTFYDTWEYKSGLYKALGGTNTTPTTGGTQYLVSEGESERVQVDIGWKF